MQKKIVTPIPLSRIEFSWSNAFKFAIPEQCFSEFSLLKEFGSLQISYCQVGRHLTELFAANDLELPIEHIQPARFFSANSALWFGPDIPAVYEANYLVEIEKWFKQNEPKFNAAGVHWDRPDKALGLVTVAQLNKKFNSIEEHRQFQREIAHFNTVLKVQIS